MNELIEYVEYSSISSEMESTQYYNKVIETYFNLGLTYKEILYFLAHDHRKILSERTLRRRLSKLGLFRRKGTCDILEIALFILQEIETSGRQLGYRLMHRKCQNSGFRVSRETIRILLGLLDDEGTKSRAKRKLSRRTYISSGPNAIWHMDGYDKLKPYGICIHGCIDGFSRYLIWLEAWHTNNDPRVVSRYYFEAVTKLSGCPERVRSDCGTENTHVADMQRFLRNEHIDTYSGQNSFLFGTSVTNQRIESWWSMLRKQWAQYWMDIFHQLKDDGVFTGDFIDKGIIQFCFLPTIQSELDSVANIWNFHHIRASKTAHGPHGKPVVLYSAPALYGADDLLKPVTRDVLNLCEDECANIDRTCPCDPVLFELCSLIMEELNIEFPANKTDLPDLYLCLRNEIRNEL